MTKPLERSRPKRSNILEKIKVEGNLDERREVIVCCKAATLKWKGFESRMAIWNKIYERV